VLKISQAIAVEIRLADLLPKLMRIAIESAGAQRGLFIQESTGRLVIEAEGAVGVEAVRSLEAIPIDDGARVATSVVRYVRNTSMSVVVSDALRDDRFSADPYVQAMRPRSILSVPVVHQGRVSGILYLEHRLAPNVFTNERVSLMQLVSAQAAIALENAGLYRTMTDEASQRRRAEEMLREVTEGTATTLGEGFFRSLVQHLASALRVRYAFVTECREARTRARSLAFWSGDGIADNFEYEVADTPCKGVFEGGLCYYPRGVQRAFPKDLDLVSLKAESYLGAPMVDAAGQVIGHIAVLDERPMEDDRWAASVLSIFSARAGAELERLHAERELRAALVEVETLKNRLQAENVYLQDEIRGEHNFEDMVGSSPALLDVLRKVERVAATDATVLILGDTGTGKELIARALHSRSARKHRPLVKVNCGAISAGLVESELFGHVKGAFTGAIDKRVGRFELADGGTIFLDEVGELPLESQVKLLRVLQEQEFEPVGSSRTVRVNVRVIAATNRDLERAIAEGRFRADLFFRLNVVSLMLPPLRERQSDVPLLVTFFVSRFAKQFGKRIDAISQDTIRLLSDYAWPGNIRELQNVVERAVVLSDGPVLSLGPDLLPRLPLSGAASVPASGAAPASPGGQALDDMERRHIEAVLRQVNYVIEGPAGAAQVLGLHPNTLRSRMKRLGVTRPRNIVATKA
jgi:formate hydrogenlyase transcriptional activator